MPAIPSNGEREGGIIGGERSRVTRVDGWLKRGLYTPP